MLTPDRRVWQGLTRILHKIVSAKWPRSKNASLLKWDWFHEAMQPQIKSTPHLLRVVSISSQRLVWQIRVHTLTDAVGTEVQHTR
jgi:hypothetical protein